MSIRSRTLIIGMAGPAIQAVGITWALIHLFASHLNDPLSPRHVIFETPFLIILVGFLVSIVCIPVAVEVAKATLDDVAIPAFGPTRVDDQVELQAETAK